MLSGLVATPCPASAWSFEVHKFIMARAVPLLPPELQFGHGDVDGLVRAIGWVLAVERNAVGRALREVVVTEHSVEAWADRVVSLSG